MWSPSCLGLFIVVTGSSKPQLKTILSLFYVWFPMTETFLIDTTILKLHLGSNFQLALIEFLRWWKLVFKLVFNCCDSVLFFLFSFFKNAWNPFESFDLLSFVSVLETTQRRCWEWSDGHLLMILWWIVISESALRVYDVNSGHFWLLVGLVAVRAWWI